MENKWWRWSGIVLLMFLFFTLGYGISYERGVHDGLRVAVGVGTYLLKEQNITFELSEEKITNAILRYYNGRSEIK